MKLKTNIHKLIFIFYLVILIHSFSSLCNSWIYANDDLNLYCKSDIAMDFDSGNILYNKNAFDKIYPASTTKILTCILAIENLDLNDTFIISNNVILNTPSDSSVMGIKAGELYKIEELLYGLMLPSRK